MIDHNHYTYRVIWSSEDGEYVGLCAEFSSLSFLAENHTEALQGIIDTVGEVIEDMAANNEDIPEPFVDKQYSGKILVRMLPDMHRTLAIKAAEQGVSLNRYISAQLS